MTEAQRLELICDAVRYCQAVAEKGMPRSCFTKALREPVFFLWEKHGRSKLQSARFRSRATLGLKPGGRRLVYDHSIPFRLVQDQLLSLAAVSPATVREVLASRLFVCILTPDEDRRLRRLGLNHSMPASWDGTDPLARYRQAAIDVVENPDYVDRAE